MLIGFLCGFLALIFLISWFYRLLADPVYINYDYDAPDPLAELNVSPYKDENFTSSGQYLYYEDGTYTSLEGIDVSSHNGEIDWQQVKAEGIDFVFLRVGYRTYLYGEIHEDERFEEYYEGARKAGLQIGVYFFSQAVSEEEAMEEAFFTLEHIRHKQIDLPIAFDMEDIDYDDSRIDHVDFDLRTEAALAFCEKIRENGRVPLIYGNLYWLSEVFDPSLILHYPLWYAHYTDRPDYPYEYRFWQYSDAGEVPGIPEATDLDIWFVKK